MEVISHAPQDREQVHTVATPSRTQFSQTMTITDAQKQALIDNLQLEGKPLSPKQATESVDIKGLSSHGTSTKAQSAIFLASTKPTNESRA